MAKRSEAVDHADGTRTCARCGQRLPLSEYHIDKNATLGYRAQCKMCRSTAMKGWYQANQIRQRDRQRERYATNTEAIRIQDMERYERHRAKRIRLATDAVHKRRALIAAGEYEDGITVIALRARHGDRCCYCNVVMTFERCQRGGRVPTRATLEHVIPVSRGGSHTWSNVRLACWRCNSSKQNRTADEWDPVHGARSVRMEAPATT